MICIMTKLAVVVVIMKKLCWCGSGDDNYNIINTSHNINTNDTSNTSDDNIDKDSGAGVPSEWKAPWLREQLHSPSTLHL